MLFNFGLFLRLRSCFTFSEKDSNPFESILSSDELIIKNIFFSFGLIKLIIHSFKILFSLFLISSVNNFVIPLVDNHFFS
jgi:hypothetical protein